MYTKTAPTPYDEAVGILISQNKVPARVRKKLMEIRGDVLGRIPLFLEKVKPFSITQEDEGLVNISKALDFPPGIPDYVTVKLVSLFRDMCLQELNQSSSNVDYQAEKDRKTLLNRLNHQAIPYRRR